MDDVHHLICSGAMSRVKLSDAHRLTADPSHVRSSFIIQHSSFGWETVPSVGLWNGCVLSFSIRRVLCSGGKRLGLLGCGTVQICLFRCNNVEFISRHSSFINQSRLIFESILKDKQVPWRFSVCVCVNVCVCLDNLVLSVAQRGWHGTQSLLL